MKQIPIIFDVDTGLDDATTLFMAAKSPTLKILAVTATYGNNLLQHTLQNTLNVLKLCDRTDIPVAAGAARPLVKKFPTDEEKEQGGGFVHGENGLGGFVFPFPDTTEALSDKAAWDLMYEKLIENDTSVVICCLGPLTDAAILLQKYPEAKDRIRCFVNMGGYIRSGTLSPMSSVNIFSDARAAEIVLESGIPFYMCPGDLTGQALISLEEMEQMKQYTSPVGRAACEMIYAYYKTCSKLGENKFNGLTGQCMHDNCALAFIEHPEMFTYGRYFCRAESQSELCIAMTVIDYEDTLKKDSAEKNLFFVDKVDRDAFASYFLSCFAAYECR